MENVTIALVLMLTLTACADGTDTVAVAKIQPEEAVCQDHTKQWTWLWKKHCETPTPTN